LSLTGLLGEEFLNSEECLRALTHRSVSSKNNERLEYLGDSLLGFFIANWLFKHFPSYPEGDLTRIRAHLVKKDTLAEIAREHDIGKHLVLGAGELKSGGLQKNFMLFDLKIYQQLTSSKMLKQDCKSCCNLVVVHYLLTIL